MPAVSFRFFSPTGRHRHRHCNRLVSSSSEDHSEESRGQDGGAQDGVVVVRSSSSEDPGDHRSSGSLRRDGIGLVVGDGRGEGLLVPHEVSRIVLRVALPEAVEGLARTDDLRRAGVGEPEGHPEGAGDALAVHLLLDDLAIRVEELRGATAQSLLGSLDPLGLLDGIERAEYVGVEGHALSAVVHRRPGGALVGSAVDPACVPGGDPRLLLQQAGLSEQVTLDERRHFLLEGRCCCCCCSVVRFFRRHGCGRYRASSLLFSFLLLLSIVGFSFEVSVRFGSACGIFGVSVSVSVFACLCG
mmetsp:Transcript_1860/g.4850  ORF Transcript_1860/g.4850 Transcript_1860/m.4850 type:complete len:301 (-) Transcript_1860:45-947(-)